MKLKEFIQCLEYEKNSFRQLIEILKQEEKAFLQSNFSGFDEILSRKKVLLEQLSLYDVKRNQLIKNNGWPIEIKETTNYLERHYNNSSEVFALWSEFITLAKTTKELNDTNGLIISAHLKLNKQTLSALHCAAESIFLYGPRGQAYI